MRNEHAMFPHDEEAERGVLSAMMFADPGSIAEIRLVIGKRDFFLTQHATIFEAMCSIFDGGGRCDAVAVRYELSRRQLLEEIGGTGYVAEVLLSQPGSSGAMHYAGIVRETSIRRQIADFAEKLRRKALEPASCDNAVEIMQEALGRLTQLVTSGQKEEASSIGEILIEVREQLANGGIELVPSGFTDLDSIVGGVGIGEMVLVGARPSMGKSTLLRQWAMQCAKAGVPAGFISLEESRHKVGRNWLAYETLIENKKIRGGNLTADEFEEVEAGIRRLENLPLYVTESARRLADIKARATVWKSKYGIKILFIDYLQRIRGVSGGSRYEVASETSSQVSDMLKELQLAGVVAVQLNRALETRDEKRPIMSDIRESGQIEQDADGIIFLHREDYFHRDNDAYSPTNDAELSIAKWRDGARGKAVILKSALKYQRFANRSEGVALDYDPTEGAFE